MPEKLALLHTSSTLIPLFDKLCDEHLPEIQRFHVSDDSLIKNVIAEGKLSHITARRVVQHIISAEAGGATRVLVTCSSIGAAVEWSRNLVSIPVYRVDEAMADQAVTTGQRIGVIATLPTTLEPTQDLVRRRAALLNRKVDIRALLCDGAFDLLMSGNTASHDSMVAEALRNLAEQTDVIVLAQASMARVADGLSVEEKRIPILASPELAVRHLAECL